MNKAFPEVKQASEFEERVLEINRISRTVKGGRRIRFRALVIIGNRRGKVGFGVAKASEVVTAINKAKEYAQKHIIEVPIYKDTVPYQFTCSFGSTNIIIKPAPQGTSLLAGGSVRSLLELAGYKNIVAKSLGSNHKINAVTATINALAKLRPVRITPKPVKTEKEITLAEKSDTKETKTDTKPTKKTEKKDKK